MAKKVIDRINYINRLIKIKSTGTPDQLAKRIHISKRTVFELIKTMKEFGAPIKYDRYRRTYFYDIGGGILK
jgi:predicted DNA-binding transcriptional regulator YafY